MKGRPKRDKTICRKCRQCPPIVTIALIKGEPSGICTQCKANDEIRRRLEAKASLGLYRSMPDLVNDNLKLLSTLGNGLYSLTKQSDGAQVGYIIVKTESVFVFCYNRADLFTYDLFGIASYLGNLNALITPSRGLETLTPIDAETLDGFRPIDVSERLIWYDRALVAKAARLLKDEVKAIRAANMAIARSFRVQKTPTNSGNASD